jgi:hypothetical protein
MASQEHGKTAPRVLGTAALRGGSATLRVKSGSVLKSPITVLYGGDPHFTASMASPAPVTRNLLESMKRPTAMPEGRRGR